MQFSSFSDFINMGGYGFYVWLSFGVTALLLTLLTVISKSDHQKVIKQISLRIKREDKLRQARKNKQQQSTIPPAKLSEVSR